MLLNLGQGVAWDKYIGRGVRRNHPEDYPEYVKGCDIASFDIYPARATITPDVAGKLWFVADGVEPAATSGPTTGSPSGTASNARTSATRTPKPRRSRCKAEVWMSLVHGSRGMIYFVHQFKPKFNEPRCSTTRCCCRL